MGSDSEDAESARHRAQTDANLDAERAGDDGATSAADVRRILDDAVERDRARADDRLFLFRATADRAQALLRFGPSSAASPEVERDAADLAQSAERRLVDGLRDGERERADAATATKRSATAVGRAEQELRRKSTDDQLTTERESADATAAEVDRTLKALVTDRDERGRRGDLLAVVAHDLRSPLQVIELNGRYLTGCIEDPAAREAAEDVIRAAARMERLLGDLLDASRTGAGMLRVVKRPHDVGALLAEVRTLYQPIFCSRRMALVLEAPSGPVVVPIDHDRIVQVLSNLLGNAMKFMSAGGTVHLSVQAREDDVEVAVRDDGPGIQAEHLQQVFERFWQKNADHQRGLGLGLHICKQIIEAHGGHIVAESEVGKGATFRFTLPLEDRPVATWPASGPDRG